MSTLAPPFTPDPLLVQAVRVLAARCDGAATKDGQGFNGTDSTFGKNLADTPEAAWTPGNARAAHKMLRTYRQQLASCGVTYADIPAPHGDDTSRAIRTVTLDGATLVIRFTYEPAIIAAIRHIPGARWSGKAWTAPVTSADAVAAFARTWDMAVLATQEEIAAAVEAGGPAEPAGTLTLRGEGRIAIKFTYLAIMVEDVRKIPGRVWADELRAWVVPASSVTPARAFAAKYGLAVDPAVAELADVTVDTRPVVDADGGRFVLRFDYDRDRVAAVKEIPGAYWHAGYRAWEIPSSAGLEVLLFAGCHNARITEDAGVLLTGARAMLADIEASAAADADFHVEGLGGTLLPYQRAGVAYAVRKRRTFIADEQGLGKTVQALAVLQAAEAFPAVIVVPAGHVRTNWGREARKWLPTRTVEVIRNGRPKPLTADVTIISYDMIWRWTKVLGAHPGGLRALVLDESHRAKNPGARRTKALIATADLVAPDAIVLNLTGTPAPNRPRKELGTQLRILGRIGEFPGLDLVRGSAALVALHRQLRATCFVRRLKIDVLPDLPPKRWAQVVIDGDPAVMEEYRKAEDDVIAHLAEKARAAALEAGEDPEDAEAAGWRAVMRAKAAEHLVALNVLRRLAAEAKRPAINEWIGDFLEGGNKLIVFGHHRDIVGRVAEVWAGGCKIQGGDSDKARAAAVDGFMENPDQKVIACSIAAAGVGITLTAASDVLFVQQDWTPGGMDQAVDRAHRIGQHDSVTGWVMMVEGTIDGDMAELIAAKRVEIDAAIDGRAGDDTTTASVVADLIVRLAERGLAKGARKTA